MTRKPEPNLKAPPKNGRAKPQAAMLETDGAKSTMSEDDHNAIEAFKARQAKRPPVPEVSLRNLDEDWVGMVHAANAFASGDLTFTVGLCQQLQHIVSAGAPFPIDQMNFMLAIIKEIEPRSQIEALLASHMAAVHCATMECFRRMENSLTVDRRDAELSTINRLTRTFVGQMEALKRCRSSGQQTIRVQHVTVNEGGNAIVGNVQTGGGGPENMQHQPHEPSFGSECGPALLSPVEALRLDLSLPGGERLDCLSLSRSEVGGTKR
jgi:hypothetical protein